MTRSKHANDRPFPNSGVNPGLLENFQRRRQHLLTTTDKCVSVIWLTEQDSCSREVSVKCRAKRHQNVSIVLVGQYELTEYPFLAGELTINTTSRALLANELQKKKL